MIELGRAKKEKDPFLTLDKVYVHDFGDNYHKDEAEIADKSLMREVKNLRKRYKTFQKYAVARNIYNEYMEILYDKYGGYDKFCMFRDADLITEFLPGQPKLKETPVNKFITKHGIFISSDPNQVAKHVEKMKEYDEIMGKEISGDAYIDPQIQSNKDKDLRKLMIESGGKVKHDKYTIKRIREVDAMDFLESYITASGVKNKKSKKGKKLKESDIYKPLHVLLDEQDKEPEYVMYEGRRIKREDAEEQELYMNLYKYGWNTLALYKEMNKHSKKDYKSRDLENVLKNQKYELKEEERSKKKQSKADKFMAKFVDDNTDFGLYDDFDEYEQEMLRASINELLN